MGLEEQILEVVSQLQSGQGRSLYGSLTLMRKSLIKSSQGRGKLVQAGAVRLLLDLLEEKPRHSGQTNMPDLIMSILANLCLDDAASKQILKCGGLETIATFTLASEAESIQNRGIRALSNLAQVDGVVDELFNLEVPEFVADHLLVTANEECQVTYCRALCFETGQSGASVGGSELLLTRVSYSGNTGGSHYGGERR
ncbi:leydig cell tumor 10 kda protein homolog [Plakobranchus ocellatus]|uniref:Leydig cell tumor 10 kDa protein homolog n=1 Tax=Plakobranchus ocellatus TaxID=259542 RepID=A0AAV4DQC6_9GAST|nr:leydig cell tumor 10 kda protein homolog [Plakobranchus ocellatus]